MTEWHGFTVMQGTETAFAPVVHIGPLPGRKGIALYVSVKNDPKITVLAFFASHEAAQFMLNWLDTLVKPLEDKVKNIRCIDLP